MLMSFNQAFFSLYLRAEFFMFIYCTVLPQNSRENLYVFRFTAPYTKVLLTSLDSFFTCSPSTRSQSSLMGLCGTILTSAPVKKLSKHDTDIITFLEVPLFYLRVSFMWLQITDTFIQCTLVCFVRCYFRIKAIYR